MVLPKVLSPSFWVDKCLTLALQLVLALLLQILYILKGEDVRVTDVKVTVRKATPSDGKSIIQAPAKATRPARQNITLKAGPNAATDESTREIKAPVITSKKPSEEQIITGTLTELKPDKIENIEAKAEISTSTATPIIEMKSEETKTATVEVEKSEDIVEPKKEKLKVQTEEIEPIEVTLEVKVDNTKIISETVEEDSGILSEMEEESSEIISEPVEIKADETEISEIISEVVEEGSEIIPESIEVTPQVKVDGTEVSEIISEVVEEGSEIIPESIEVTPEVKVDGTEVSEIISEVVEVAEEDTEIISESIEIIPEVKADEVEVSKITPEAAEGVSEMISEVAEEGSEIISETVEEVSETFPEPVEVIPEVKVDETEASEIISETVEEGSESEDTAEDDTEIAQLPLEMKTSHEFAHLTDSNIKLVEFRWNHGGNKVFVTGDFDNWKATAHEMQPDYTNGGFIALIPIDRTKQHEFKFVVDGNWWINTDLPTKRDEHGNENNVIYAFGLDPLGPEYKEYAEISTSYQLAAAY